MFVAKRFLVLAVTYTVTQVSSYIVKARPTTSSQGQYHHQQQQGEDSFPIRASPILAPLSFDIRRRSRNAKMNRAAYRSSLEDGEEEHGQNKYMNVADEDEEDEDGEEYYCEVVDDMGCVAVEDRSKNDQEQDTRYIRVEKGPNEDIKRFKTRQDVIDEIDRVRQVQAQAGRSDLYKRTWEATGEVPSRPVVNGDGKMSISVLQFNALAEGLSSGSVPTPFPKMETESSYNDAKTKKTTSTSNKKGEKEKEFGGFSQIQSPEVCLDFSLRRWRLVEVLLQQYMRSDKHDDEESALMDIIGLQEVDRYHGFLAPILQLFGYEGRFAPKPLAPGVRFGWYSDGCALFWKASTFTLVSERYHPYDVGNQVLLVVTLRHVLTHKLFVVAVTHLKAQRNPTNESIRCAQVEELLHSVTEAVQEAAQLQQSQTGRASRNNDIPVLILGDFNADPPSRITPGVESSVGKLLHHRINANTLRSAYPVDPPKPGFYTTWKTRGGDEVMRIIDYILYGGNGLTCTSLLQVPDGDELEPGRLPGLRYPSDHMMIAAKFEF